MMFGTLGSRSEVLGLTDGDGLLVLCYPAEMLRCGQSLNPNLSPKLSLALSLSLSFCLSHILLVSSFWRRFGVDDCP